MGTEIKKQLGSRLEAIRRSKGFKQEDLTDHNFSYRHYGKIERGQVNPTLDTIVRICDIFQISLSELFSFTDTQTPATEIQQEVAAKITSILRENDERKLNKLKVFLDNIL